MSPVHEDNAYDRLRAAILSLDLVPGERLSERGLESVLGASRTPIRVALMRLENDGLTQRAGRAWQVAPIDVAEVRAVMEYREALEVAAVTLAVERADDEELAALRELAAANRDTDDEETGLRDGSDFHVALARLSRNQFLGDGMAGALTRISRARWLLVRTPDSRAAARDGHLGIIAAVKERDPGKAVALTVAHNRDTRDRLLAYLTEERRRLRGRGFSIIESSGNMADRRARLGALGMPGDPPACRPADGVASALPAVIGGCVAAHHPFFQLFWGASVRAGQSAPEREPGPARRLADTRGTPSPLPPWASRKWHRCQSRSQSWK